MALREIDPSNQTAGQISQDLYKNLLENIPPAIQAPEVERLQNTNSLLHVVFDIETTSTNLHQSDIIQLSAACGEHEFNVHITPQLPIHPYHHRFSMREEKRCLDGQPVEAESSAREAFQKFICWLREFDDQVVLLAHNGKIFDAPRLILQLQEHGLLEDFKSNVIGFVDTLILFEKRFSLKKPSLKSLVKQNIPNYEYKAHDSSEDVRALKDLLDKTSADIEVKLFDDASFSLAYVIAYVEYVKKRYENIETLRSLPISEDMMKRTAGSGLQYCDLQLAYQKAGKNGIERVLSESVNGKPRVTKSKNIILQVCDHFNANAL